MEYKVIFAIEIKAETPEEAALVIEDYMRNSHCRPFLTVIDCNEISKEIDLESSDLKLENL